MLKLLDALERSFVVASLILFTGAVVALLRQGSGTTPDIAQSDPVLQIAFFGIYAVTAFLILLRWRRFIRVFARDKLLLLLIVLALVSVLWSADPEVTLRRGVALVGTTMFGAYLALRYSLGEQLRLLAWAIGIAAVLSLLFALALPGYGISGGEYAGAWRGAYVHKNGLGRVMALGAVIFLLLAVGGRSWMSIAGLGLSVGLLLLSDSKTALAIFLAMPPLVALYRILRWRSTVMVPFLITAVLLGAVLTLMLLSNTESVLDALGRDITLSNRTDLWSLIFDAIRERPWLGYGYSGFWLGWEGKSAILWLLGWEVIASDNGYLDLWLNLGLLGVLVFALGFLSAYSRALAWARRTRSADDLWPATYLSFLLLYNLTESTILIQNNIFWILYVTTVLSTFFVPNHRVPRTAQAVQAPSASARRTRPSIGHRTI